MYGSLTEIGNIKDISKQAQWLHVENLNSTSQMPGVHKLQS